ETGTEVGRRWLTTRACRRPRFRPGADMKRAIRIGLLACLWGSAAARSQELPPLTPVALQQPAPAAPDPQDAERLRKQVDVLQKQIEVLQQQVQLLAEQLKKQPPAGAAQLPVQVATLDARSVQAAQR